tara:strand:- start:80 stop:841 length:762 start_codon:yes stop_codon:yes gene_type:complete
MHTESNAMAKITLETFKNTFKFYNSEAHQQKAIEELYQDIDLDLLDDNADWIKMYRNKLQPTPPKAYKPAWPVTKQGMAEIMGCSVGSLPDELMQDFANCCETFDLNLVNIGYFLGQCGHESGGLRWPLELSSGSQYNFREDLGNIYPGDGEKFRGHGWLQNTGRANTQAFSDYMDSIGKSDYKIMDIGAEHVGNVYPWTVSGFWWSNNNMVEYCNTRPDVDRVGARVNGRYLPNGYEDRRYYTTKAFSVLGI